MTALSHFFRSAAVPGAHAPSERTYSATANLATPVKAYAAAYPEVHSHAGALA